MSEMMPENEYMVKLTVDPESVCALLDRLVDICIDAASENTFQAYADAATEIMDVCGSERFRLTNIMGGQ